MSMRFSKQDKEKLHDAFIITYHEQESSLESSDLPQQVMKRIREINIDNNNEPFTILFEQFVWRMAPVALCAIVILTLIIMNMRITPEYEIAQMVGSDPIAYDVIQFYGK